METTTDHFAAAGDITALLIQHGWKQDTNPLFRYCGTKDYETEVGIKTASAACSANESEGHFHLWGTYVSEGRNVLETASVFIPFASGAEERAGLVDLFAANADMAVDQSYARRLHLRHGDSPRG